VAISFVILRLDRESTVFFVGAQYLVPLIMTVLQYAPLCVGKSIQIIA